MGGVRTVVGRQFGVKSARFFDRVRPRALSSPGLNKLVLRCDPGCVVRRPAGRQRPEMWIVFCKIGYRVAKSRPTHRMAGRTHARDTGVSFASPTMVRCSVDRPSIRDGWEPACPQRSHAFPLLPTTTPLLPDPLSRRSPAFRLSIRSPPHAVRHSLAPPSRPRPLVPLARILRSFAALSPNGGVGGAWLWVWPELATLYACVF